MSASITPPFADFPVLRTGQAPIGVFDSGMGGLSIVQALQAHLPHQSIIYLADTKHVPYGNRPDHQIRDLTAQAVAWLYAQGCKAVVVACNTASAFSLTHLRELYGAHFPVIGLVPAVKPAVLKTRTRVIGVLATPGTLRGTLLQDVIRQVAVPNQVRVLTVVSPALVPFVEQGLQHSAACRAELKTILQPLVQANADHLVLGCTHYPFLKDSIAAVFGQQFQLIDSGVAVARQTARVLLGQPHNQPLNQQDGQLLNQQDGQLDKLLPGPSSTPNPLAALRCYVTGDIARAQPVINQLMQCSAHNQLTVYPAVLGHLAP